jgi:acetyl-CoA C-acetyltransferase
VQISRFCASGLDAVNFAAQIMSSQQLGLWRRRINEPRRHRHFRRLRWTGGGAVLFMPQGVSADLIATKYGFSRHDTPARSRASSAAKAWDEAASTNRWCR